MKLTIVYHYPEDNCCKQAIAQVCAVCSPLRDLEGGTLSVMGMFQQLSGSDPKNMN